MQLIDYIKAPWPWYIAGPLIGLTVPLLLIIGNRSFGISSNLRHICAACFPARISFFQYNWKAESWNLFFAVGILIGGFVAAQFFTNDSIIQVHPHLQQQLSRYGISVGSKQVPVEVFNWQALLTIRGFLMMVIGGFFVGFGTRYAGGCTSGHAIMGLSSLQWPSLIATLCFLAGGFIMANFILPLILSLH